jgi:hypothetical protein
MWKDPLNVRPFPRQRRPVNFHEADIMRAGVETQLPQPTSIQRLRDFFRHSFSPVRFHRGMLLEWRVHKISCTIPRRMPEQTPVTNAVLLFMLCIYTY